MEPEDTPLQCVWACQRCGKLFFPNDAVACPRCGSRDVRSQRPRKIECRNCNDAGLVCMNNRRSGSESRGQQEEQVKSYFPEGCKARGRKVVWVDPPPKTATCDCGCVVPTDKDCHCGAVFSWHVDPYQGWVLTITPPSEIIIKIRGVDDR
jgi:DNA-directed RNA polymerase subunit RPC12/RpoP